MTELSHQTRLKRQQLSSWIHDKRRVSPTSHFITFLQRGVRVFIEQQTGKYYGISEKKMRTKVRRSYQDIYLQKFGGIRVAKKGTLKRGRPSRSSRRRSKKMMGRFKVNLKQANKLPEIESVVPLSFSKTPANSKGKVYVIIFEFRSKMFKP